MKKILFVLLVALCSVSFGFGVMFINDDDRLIVVSCESPECDECISKCEHLENTKEKLDCVKECDAVITINGIK